MKAIVQAFYSEPVVVLACLAVAAPILVAEGVIAGVVGALVVAVVAVLQRHFVRPDKTRAGPPLS